MWGVDLGVRSVAMFGVDYRTGRGVTQVLECRAPKSVANQDRRDRHLELSRIARFVREMIGPGDLVFVEEPPAAGTKNYRTFGKLNQVAGAVMAGSLAPAEYVEVGTWKKLVVGIGNASKADCAQWLSENRSHFYKMCEADQNRIDAACIALYGTERTRQREYARSAQETQGSLV